MILGGHLCPPVAAAASGAIQNPFSRDSRLGPIRSAMLRHSQQTNGWELNMNRFTPLAALATLATAVPALALADSGHDHGPAHSAFRADSPLVAEVYGATKRFKDINVALGEGWVQGTPCVSGP